ncbi:MAG: SDR family oxidoreductase [Eubacteriales bacterium]|nr:SDR family oxidoreductase [Eubacteriales bacterium]
MKRLEGKTAVITGASRGIGRAIALLFAKEGCKVCVNYTSLSSAEKARDVVKEIKDAGGEAFAFRADISNAKEVRDMYKALIEKYGKFDILVNNAGILVQGKLIDISYEEVKDMLNIDLFALFVTIKEAFHYLKDAESGRIINIASQLGQKGGNELSAYSAAKGGVIALTKALALEFGALGMKTNILINAVAPGPVDIGQTEHVSKEWRAAKEPTLPLGRYSEAEEIAPAVLFLASDEATAFIGQTICPNSGDTMIG